MSALYRADGTRLTKTAMQALTTAVPDPQLVTVNEDVYALRPYDQAQGKGATDQSPDGMVKYLKYPAGTIITAAERDANFPPATVDEINPNSGPQAGGTEVTITGTNLSGVTGVTFDGVAGTDLEIVSQTEIKVTTPAGAAGPANVVVQDDSGDVNVSNGFTYV